MTPRSVLIAVSIGIIIFNILTVKYRERHLSLLEKRLRVLSEEDGKALTIESVSRDLNMPVYDARILMRKFVSKGKVDVRAGADGEAYVFKSES